MSIKIICIIFCVLCLITILLLPSCTMSESKTYQICFISSRSGVAENTDLWIMNEDGSNRVNLTNSESFEDGISCSPDGDEIAFYSKRDGDLNDNIYILDINNQTVKRITNDDISASNPKWSTDGKRIAFLRQGVLWVMDSDGANQSSLEQKVDSGFFEWSPNGKHIAFQSENGIALIYVKTKELFLTKNKGDEAPAWSPDGEKLAFTSNREGEREIYTITIKENKINKLTNFKSTIGAGKIMDWAPIWSSDGNNIAFVGKGNIYILELNNNNMTNVSNNLPGTSVIQNGGWSPDGYKIAFVLDVYTGNEKAGIYTINNDGNNRVLLTPDGMHDMNPIWRPTKN